MPPNPSSVSAGNLLASVPGRLEAEVFEPLLEVGDVLIERIVSTGQSTPEGMWYDQTWDEWVVLLTGWARLRLEGEPGERILAPGDHLFLPARVRHRVTGTAPDETTIWLAVHVGRRETPGADGPVLPGGTSP